MSNIIQLKLSAFLQIANSVITKIHDMDIDLSDDNYYIRLNDMPLSCEIGYLEDNWQLKKKNN